MAIKMRNSQLLGTRYDVLIPEHDENEGPYPGGIQPGWQNLQNLLRLHKHNPEAIQFIADML